MKRAFILVELLIAATLSVTVLVALQTLLVGTLQRARAVEKRIAAQAEKAGGLELLADDLACLAATPDLGLENGRLSFAGLNSLCLAGEAVRRTVRIQYEWRTDGTATQSGLIRHESAPHEPELRHSVLVATDVTEWQVTVSDGQTWHANWPLATPRQPVRVRIHLRKGVRPPIDREIRLSPLIWRTHHD